MARRASGFFPVSIVISGALGLASCENLHNSVGSLTEGMPMQAMPAATVSPPPMVTVSEGIKEDRSQITALEADNAKLKNQLAGALKENAKLKKDLADAIDDKALLKDLAAKKQR